MPIKRIAMLLCCSFLILATTQDIKAFGLVVKKLYCDNFDITAQTTFTQRYDKNNRLCGLIKCITPLSRLNFKGDFIGDILHHSNEYYLYLPDGSNSLIIEYPPYNPLNIDLSHYLNNGCVNGGSTYILELTCESYFLTEEQSIETVWGKAQNGDPIQQYNLGYAYFYGKGVGESLDDTEKWWLLSAKQNCSYAQYSLGLFYLEDRSDIQNAIKWFEKAHENGNIQSAYYLGYIYVTNQFENRIDYERAIKYFEIAAESGNEASMYNLGLILEDEDYINHNIANAIKWHKQCALLGNSQAQYHLGRLYYENKKIPQNIEESLKYFSLAAEQGDSDAQNYLGVIYEEEFGYGATAVKWYLKSAEQGNPSAQFNLALMYENSNLINNDLVESIKWYMKAAQQGLADAQYNLGLKYLKGIGIKQNTLQALEWFMNAAEQGLANAQYNIGLIYLNGDGVEINMAKAKEWWLRAASQNHVEAINALKKYFGD